MPFANSHVLSVPKPLRWILHSFFVDLQHIVSRVTLLLTWITQLPCSIAKTALSEESEIFVNSTSQIPLYPFKAKALVPRQQQLFATSVQ